MRTHRNKKIEYWSSTPLVYATECEEFYYNGSDEVVPEGQAIGMDVEILDKALRRDGNVDLILFEDIYWNPPW